MKLICFDVHLVICCCKERSFQDYADHRDPTDEDSLLMVFEFNPLGLEDLSRILNLTMSNSRLGEDCWEFC
jgi:hypothetical protein